MTSGSGTPQRPARGWRRLTRAGLGAVVLGSPWAAPARAAEPVKLPPSVTAPQPTDDEARKKLPVTKPAAVPGTTPAVVVPFPGTPEVKVRFAGGPVTVDLGGPTLAPVVVAPPALNPVVGPPPAAPVVRPPASVAAVPPVKPPPPVAEPAPVPGTTPVVPASGSTQDVPAPRPNTAPPVAAPPAAAPPAAPPAAGQPLPAPRPVTDDRVRLPRLGNPLGTTPVPTAKDLEEIAQFVDGVVDPKSTLDLIEGRSRLLLLKQTPTQTQIADPAVVQLNVLNPQQLTLVGRRVGTTVLTLWFADPKDKAKERVLSYLVRVLPDPETKERLERAYKVLEKEINAAFPNSRVCLTLVGDKLMVSGQAHDIAEATQILRILRANAPGGEQATDRAGGEAARVPVAAIQPAAVAGDPANPVPAPGAESYLTAGGPRVINNLRIPGEQQVTLKVTVAEVNRAAARSIGVNWSILNNRGLTVFGQRTGGLGAGSALGTLTGGSGLGTAGGLGSGGLGAGGQGANLPVNVDGGQVPILINALRNLNYARFLAEPNLTAMNGQTATFLAGGQFPVPVLGGLGAFGTTAAGLGGLQGVQFVPYGVQLAFTPFITDRDRVRLTVQATVSTRDLSAATQISGANVPGLNSRTFGTTVELREGQTLAVAGLIQNNLGADSTRVPLFGDLPYVGHLAGVSRVQHGEQELVILITPELVHPLDPKELLPLPGADIFEPGDVEFYAQNRLESRRSHDYRSSARTDVHRMLKYRRCEEAYIFGPSGHADPAPVPLP